MKKLPSLAPSLAFLLMASFLAAGAMPAAAQQPVRLSFLNAPFPGEPIRRPPTLGLSIGGPVHSAVMDTGSTGIVVSATSIAGFDALPQLGPGELTYTSSGRVMRGVYVETPVTIVGADGASITTRPIRILAVTRIDCLESARDCRPIDAPRRVSMLGIGFARSHDHQPGAGPARNPFLNLPGMGDAGGPGRLRRGYIVDREGVQVGLGEGDRAAFARVKLARDGAAGDWAAAPVCIGLEDRTPDACGTMLLDTGVSTMYLSLPSAQTDGLETYDMRGDSVLADGVRVRVRPGPDAPAPDYGFIVGDRREGVVPEKVIVVGRGERPTFINTTVRALNAFDYLFDQDAGEVGFRRR
ncbi:hypothetical protein ABLE93_21130 [Xanthobacter sp. KR7-65]|uniref:hypothetical protein n=1 Tax=Xanthobacter sp. KR7-65 TaxID=3156612 RepID=UPI0032B5E63F